jgi:hypothetical protein
MASRAVLRFFLLHGKATFMAPRILTLTQFQIVYQIGQKTALRMCQQGEIPAFKAGGRWRIVDIGAHLVELAQRQGSSLEATPFLRGVETAALLRVSSRRLRKLAEDNRIDHDRRSGRRVYSLESVLQYAAQRDRKHARRGSYIRPAVMAWAQSLLAKKLATESLVTVPDFVRDEAAANPAKIVP